MSSGGVAGDWYHARYSNPPHNRRPRHTTHVLGIKTMTSLILDHIVTAYLYLGINTGEKVMILFLVIVLELSQD
jgi:hypothetical protein